MKILIYTPAFYPSIGGLENVTMILCKEFVKKGHQVMVITTTRNSGDDDFEFKIIRNPGFFRFLKLLKWCDVFYQPNVSLKGFLPWLFVRKPVVFSHNGWYNRRNGKKGWQDKLKFFSMRFGENISVSKAVAEHIKTESKIIPNPYDDKTFFAKSDITKTKDLIFVGRLVSDKGADILLKAVNLLKQAGFEIKVSIIGDGPEKKNLIKLVNELNVKNQIDFLGVLREKELANEISKHKILIVPSKVQEGFGIVALEGIACGCVVIGSDCGGLKDAIGKCGLTFRNGNAVELAEKIKILLQDETYLDSFKVNFAEHLENHKPEKVAKKYLEVFEKALNRSNE